MGLLTNGLHLEGLSVGFSCFLSFKLGLELFLSKLGNQISEEHLIYDSFSVYRFHCVRNKIFMTGSLFSLIFFQ